MHVRVLHHVLRHQIPDSAGAGRATPSESHHTACTNTNTTLRQLATLIRHFKFSTNPNFVRFCGQAFSKEAKEARKKKLHVRRLSMRCVGCAS